MDKPFRLAPFVREGETRDLGRYSLRRFDIFRTRLEGSGVMLSTAPGMSLATGSYCRCSSHRQKR
jgi:hypothetical protein